MTDWPTLRGELERFWAEADRNQAESSCPNGPDPETGEYPCDPKGYFGVMECQVCGFIVPVSPGEKA